MVSGANVVNISWKLTMRKNQGFFKTTLKEFRQKTRPRSIYLKSQNKIPLFPCPYFFGITVNSDMKVSDILVEICTSFFTSRRLSHRLVSVKKNKKKK